MKGFYPTPQTLVYEMLDGLKVAGTSVLDPSAGKGDILNYISKNYSRYRNELYAIEINPDLRAVLTDKGFTVVGTDFLSYPGLQYFDHIIMNPPFDQGAAHLLKAWDISKGAVIRCLLNAETINNPYTNERRRLAQIIEKYGWVKKLRQPFNGNGAERKTSVNVVMVHLQDTRTKEGFRLGFDPDTVPVQDFDLGDIENNDLAMAGICDNYESRFLATIEAFKSLLVTRQKVDYYLSPLVRDYPSPDKIISNALKSDKTSKESYQSFLVCATKAAWDHLFEKTKLSAVTTEGVRREIEKFQGSQGTMAFTAKNMEELFNTLFLSREQIMVQCVLETFDEMTKYYKENREYYEGWKTNSAYKVNKKFILPGIGSVFGSGLEWRAQRRIGDIEKALCFLSGKRYGSIYSVNTTYDREDHFGIWRQSEFFDTKLFKKGTMHFRWNDENLRIKFNSLVARERWGELPEKTKAGVYK